MCGWVLGREVKLGCGFFDMANYTEADEMAIYLSTKICLYVLEGNRVTPYAGLVGQLTESRSTPRNAYSKLARCCTLP